MLKGQKVVVRTYSAGVHVGIYDASYKGSAGKRIRLLDARRVWRWRGANTLSEVALRGVQSAQESRYTRVSESVPAIVLNDAIEVIPMSDAAWERVCAAGWAE